jgi:phosphoribosylformylglycinamidine cyclo-ligase
MGKKMTYSGVGVNYEAMDLFKRMAQLAAGETAGNLKRFGLNEVEASRGESVYLIETQDSYLAHVEEGLGTKNLVADAVRQYSGKSYYNQIAQDTVAMILNDLITLGALPLSVAMHLAVAESDWFNDKIRCRDLINGWKEACMLARCSWGGGETPTLKGIIVPGTVLLSGSAIGIIKPKERLIMPSDLRDGDAIVIIESSGIHANGLTLARKIAEKIPDGYQTELSDGRTYGEALLEPTIIYVPLVEVCFKLDIDIHYMVNVTGHGWRKLMRAPQDFSYIVEKIPEPQPVFRFIREQGPVSDKEAYGNFNMGAGFVLYVPEDDVKSVIKVADCLRMKALRAGYIEEGDKKVVIRPKNLEYLGSSLGVR